MQHAWQRDAAGRHTLRFQDVAELAEFSDTVPDDELELLAERLKLKCALISSAVDSVWRAISPDLFRALKQMRVRPAAAAVRAFLPLVPSGLSSPYYRPGFPPLSTGARGCGLQGRDC